MTEAAHRIFIRPEAWGSNIDVVIDPPLKGGALDRDFPTHDEAQRYADDIRLARGFPIIDEVELEP